MAEAVDELSLHVDGSSSIAGFKFGFMFDELYRFMFVFFEFRIYV